MKNTSVIFFVLVILAFISSCKCDTNACMQTPLNYQFFFVFQNFPDSDVAPLTIKSYAKGSNFNTLLDSSTYGFDQNSVGPLRTDIGLGAATFIGQNINDSMDYVVVLPKVNRTFYVADMNFTLQNFKCGSCLKHFTLHQLAVCTVNGIAQDNISGSDVYLNM